MKNLISYLTIMLLPIAFFGQSFLRIKSDVWGNDSVPLTNFSFEVDTTDWSFGWLHGRFVLPENSHTYRLVPDISGCAYKSESFPIFLARGEGLFGGQEINGYPFKFLFKFGIRDYDSLLESGGNYRFGLLSLLNQDAITQQRGTDITLFVSYYDRERDETIKDIWTIRLDAVIDPKDIKTIEFIDRH